MEESSWRVDRGEARAGARRVVARRIAFILEMRRVDARIWFFGTEGGGAIVRGQKGDRD